MIPLKDSSKTSIFPIVNTTLIVVNILLFTHQMFLTSNPSLLFYQYGLIPYEITTGFPTDILHRTYPFFTSMFLHDGWFHIIGNMLFLYIFGDNIEDRMGHFKYFLFYIVTGLIAALIQFLANTKSAVPIVGASGAISGVIGAYLLFYPKARILTLVPILFFIRIIYIPATVFIVIWFCLQLIGGIGSANRAGDVGGIAFWAHIGGFMAGLIIANYFDSKKNHRQKSANGYYKDRFTHS